MDYKEKVIALLNNKELSREQKEKLEEIFPELCESEDERIRKEITELVMQPTWKTEKEFHRRNELCAWLEEQGKITKEWSEMKINNIQTELQDMVDLKQKTEQGEQKPVGCPEYCVMSTCGNCPNQPIIVKQNPADVSKQEPIDTTDLTDFEKCFKGMCCDKNQKFVKECCVSLLELARKQIQGEQKPDDKIEPKFKVGDWVIDKQDIVHQIANVIENVTYHTYGYDIVGGGYFNDNTEGVRLWTIQDAKPGDVLVDTYENIGIFEKTFGNDWHSYCYLGCNGDFMCNKIGGSHDLVDTYPATKEQHDLLFQKMADAGYTFDFEKKELKKIEQKPAWSEEDRETIDYLIDYLESELDSSYTKEDKEEFTKEIELLKSLKDRVQPKQEWSKEDNKKFCRIYSILSQAADEHAFSTTCRLIGDKECIELQDFLKSLRPQNRWKPSDEQMEALNTCLVKGEISYVGQWPALQSLYNDLKKL